MRNFGIWCLCLLLLLCFASCGGKQSAVEGKLLDGKGLPLAGIKIMASQVQPIKGYEQAEAVTGADGAFRLSGLFPTSQYVLKPWVQDWSAAPLMGVKFSEDTEWALFSNTGWFSTNKTTIQTGPEGETLILSKPIIFEPMASQLVGKVVDAKGQALEGVKIVAAQKEPLKGYERFEAVTNADGAFSFSRLFPVAEYALAPVSNNWSTEGCGGVWESPSPGERAKLAEQIILRFQRSEEGVITDTQTGLEWVVGQDRDTNYTQAKQWVAACNVAYGGWRMPTRQELRSLYQQGLGEDDKDPLFKTTGRYVYAEPHDSSSQCYVHLNHTYFAWNDRACSRYYRVFAVRSRKPPKNAEEAAPTAAQAPVGNTSTVAARFTVSDEGVIADCQTGLEWIVGPDKNINYSEAEQWVRAGNAAGGGWRMPTRQELASLYQKGIGEQKMDPVFKTTGSWVWAEPRDSSSAWYFNFENGSENSHYIRGYSGNFNVFGVRSRPR